MPQGKPGFTDFPANAAYAVIRFKGEFIASTYGGLAYSSDNGKTWTTKTVREGIPYYFEQLYLFGDHLYGNGNQGLYRSFDGRNFELIPASNIPPQLKFQVVGNGSLFCASGHWW